MSVIACIGDSITYGKEWPGGGDLQRSMNTRLSSKYPGVKVANLGVNGDTSSGLWTRRADVNKYNPFRVLIWIGINDVSGSVPANTLISNLQNIYTYYKGLSYEVWALTITPCDTDSSDKNAVRATVNSWIKNTATNVDRTIDAHAAIVDPNDATKRSSLYAVIGSPNHINDTGMAAVVSLFP